MDNNVYDVDLYRGIENDLRSAKKTKNQLFKMLCMVVYENYGLKKENQTLKDEIKKHSSNTGIQKTKNERGAGRKPIDKKTVEDIKKARADGESIRSIATAYNVSVGTVHNVVKNSKIK